ncbi:hypothetical protein MKX03_027972 [Papaver bracteatum]|nr:hypothetical protein MKX03_027972 [Papaver bracteatum]
MGTRIVELPATFQFVWKIDNFSTLYSRNKVSHRSDVFSAGGAKWQVVVFPRGCEPVFDHLALYLRRVDSNKYPVNAKYKFTITSQTNSSATSDDGEEEFTTATNLWGFLKFVGLRRLHSPDSGYILNDTLEIKIKIICKVAADMDKPVKEEQDT